MYAAGIESFSQTERLALVWKNGVVTNLDNGSKNSGAQSVFVDGSDIYVVGNQYNGEFLVEDRAEKAFERAPISRAR